MSSPFINSPNLSVSFGSFCWGSYIPKPSYHSTNKNCIIISTDYQDTNLTRGIYTFDLVTNESQNIYKYNNTFKPTDHGQFIDSSNNTLILYGGGNDTFAIFDLNK
eukprot:449858_1